MLPNVLRPPTYWLKLRDQRIVKRYLAALKSFLKHHRVPKQVFDLECLAEFPPAASSIQELEQINRLRTKGILYVD